MADLNAQLSFLQWLRHRRQDLGLTLVEGAARVPCAKGTIQQSKADDLCPS